MMEEFVTVEDALGERVVCDDGRRYRFTYSCGGPMYDQIRGDARLPRVDESAASTVTSTPRYYIHPDFERGEDASFASDYSEREQPWEAALLQSFPEDFEFVGTLTSKRMQIGNAVPPLLSKCLLEEVRPLVPRSSGVQSFVTVGEALAGVEETGDADELSPKYEKIARSVEGGQKYCSVRFGEKAVPVWEALEFSDEEQDALEFIARHRRRSAYKVDQSKDGDHIERSDIPASGDTLRSLCEDGWLRVKSEGKYEEAYDLTTLAGVYPRFRRLPVDGQSWTLTTQSFQSRNFLHPTEERGLSIAEGAALQSFPDDFEFVGSMTAKRRQIGNAVPPLLGKHLFEEVRPLVDDGEGRLESLATVEEAIEDLPPLEAGETWSEDELHSAPNHQSSTVESIRGTPHGQSPEGHSYESDRRLHDDRPAFTIIANGSSYRNTHPHQPRGITLRERARLQSFPDDFEFVGNASAVKGQIGNALPPLLGKQLLEGVRPLVEDGDELDSFVTVEDVLGESVLDIQRRPYQITGSDGWSRYKQIRGEQVMRDVTEPSYTITAAFTPYLLPADFEPHEDARFGSDGVRQLTLEETALLQSFPADFEFEGRLKADRLSQIGNAVPPLLGKHVLSEVRSMVVG